VQALGVLDQLLLGGIAIAIAFWLVPLKGVSGDLKEKFFKIDYLGSVLIVLCSVLVFVSRACVCLYKRLSRTAHLACAELVRTALCEDSCTTSDLRSRGGITYTWVSSAVLVPMLARAFVFAAFLVWEAKWAKLPIVPSASNYSYIQAFEF